MSVSSARKDVKRLKARRKDLAAVVGQKVEERRKLSAERRELVATRRKKKKRDPKNAEREAALDKQIAHLHDQIMRHGDEIEMRTQQIADARKRRTKITKALKAALRKLKKLLRRGGPDAAVRAGTKDVGVHEDPPGSNWGGKVAEYIKFTGYSGPVYWCGCAACWWTIKKGGGEAPSRIRRGYAGYVAADARAGTNGLKAVSNPVKGGYGTLWNYEHIVMTTGNVNGSLVETIEGNTSAADGSQSNGGEVARKWRNRADFDVFAAQTY